MEIPCFRCSKGIKEPNDKNADYIMAEDTISIEPREVFVALKHTTETLTKKVKMEELDKEGIRKYPDVRIVDEEYDEVEILSLEESQFIENLVRVQVEVRDKEIQKTGIVCPGCYREADFVIWGVHEKTAVTR